jgi:hypothetical protein
MNDKEKLIKEKRTGEAIAKNYIGIDGKFGTILKYLGSAIISQSASNYHVNEFQDVYNLQDEDEIPTEDLDLQITELGRMFSGLKFGYNIEINYLKNGTIPVKKENTTIYEPVERVLSVTWNGYHVYIEVDSDLITFLPSPEWEEIINRIYDSAIKLQKTHRHKKIEELKIERKTENLSLLQKLREKWGI